MAYYGTVLNLLSSSWKYSVWKETYKINVNVVIVTEQKYFEVNFFNVNLKPKFWYDAFLSIVWKIVIKLLQKKLSDRNIKLQKLVLYS